MEGQIKLTDILENTYRTAKGQCKYCLRFNAEIEQPPSGWGKRGWCNNHNCRVSAISYCQSYET